MKEFQFNISTIKKIRGRYIMENFVRVQNFFQDQDKSKTTCQSDEIICFCSMSNCQTRLKIKNTCGQTKLCKASKNVVI